MLWKPGRLRIALPPGSVYWLALTAMVALAAAYAYHSDVYGQYVRYKASEAQVHRLNEEVRALEHQEQHLQERVVRLETDRLELEAESRRSRNLVREVETIYRIEVAPDGPRP